MFHVNLPGCNVDDVDVNDVADDDTSSGSLLSNLVKTKMLFLNSSLDLDSNQRVSGYQYPRLPHV